MFINADDLEGIQLDWAVCTIEGNAPSESMLTRLKEVNIRRNTPFELRLQYSSDWTLAGPLIEREKISLDHEKDGGALKNAMRQYVKSRLGDEVEIPIILFNEKITTRIKLN